MRTHLRLGMPGGPARLVILVLFLVPAVLVGRWVSRDAAARGSEWAWQWGVVVALLFLVGWSRGFLEVVSYLLVRRG